jgi:hypothetical protein
MPALIIDVDAAGSNHVVDKQLINKAFYAHSGIGVTDYSGHIADTFGLCGRRKCPGRSVTRWTNGCALSPGYWGTFKYLIFNNLARGMSVADRPQKHNKAPLTPAKLPQSPGAPF